MTISQNIKLVLKENNKSQHWLAKKSGVSQSYINELIKDKYQNPSIKLLQKIVDALGIPISRLL